MNQIYIEKYHQVYGFCSALHMASSHSVFSDLGLDFAEILHEAKSR